MRRTKLGECLSVKHGWSFKGEYFAEAGEQCILTPGNFYEKGGFKPNSGRERYYTGKYPKEYLCHKGDLIIAMTQQAEGLLGSTALVPDDNKYLHNQRIGLITCNETKIYPLFAYYLFMTKTVREQLESSASGTKVKHTSPERIYDVIVSIPDLLEQKRIANILMSIEKMINNNIEINDNLEQQVSLLYDYWFIQYNFPDEHGNPYAVSNGKMVWNDKIKRHIPQNWKVGTLLDYGKIVSGGTPSTLHPEYYSTDGNAWITPNDLSGNESNMYISHGERDITIDGINNSSATRIPKGSVLISTRAPIGYIAISENEVCTNQGFKSIVPSTPYNCYYIYYFIKRNVPALAQLGTGTTFKEVSKDTLSMFPAPLIPDHILQQFNLKIENLCVLRRKNEVENKKLIIMRDWLLPMLMNGQATIED